MGKKEQRKKNAIIGLGVLGLIVVVYFAFVLANQKREESYGKFVIFDGVEADDIIGLQIRYYDMTEDEWHLTLMNKIEGEWQMISPMQIDVEDRAIETALEDLLSADTEALLEGIDPDDLESEYGFDQPRLTVVVQLEDGTLRSVEHGKLTPIDNYYYTMIDNDSNNIYKTYAYKFSGLKREATDFANKTVFEKEQGGVNSVTAFSVQSVDGTLFSLTNEDSDWKILLPQEMDADEYSVKRYLLQLFTIELYDFESYTADEDSLAAYGLSDAQYSINVSFDDKTTTSLFIDEMPVSNFTYAYATSKPGIGRVYSTDVDASFEPALSNFLLIEAE